MNPCTSDCSILELICKSKLAFNFFRKLRQEMSRKKQTESFDKPHTPAITKSAHKIQRKEQIEDLLLKKKEEYNAKIEEKRKEKEMKEVRIFIM